MGRVSVPLWPSALSGRLPIDALVGRYPTNKLIGRGSLFKHQVLRSPALITTHPRAGCYAVLALLSEGYPPLEGRSPTRYSPVCHSTRSPKAANSVRLACVRHAASVDSEPGSNSQVKFAGPAHHIQPKPDLIDGTQLFNAIACLLGSCVVFLLRVVGGSTASHRRLAPPILTNGHPLTLDGSFSVCTHYLVFKEPKSHLAPCRRGTSRAPQSGDSDFA